MTEELWVIKLSSAMRWQVQSIIDQEKTFDDEEDFARHALLQLIERYR
ncbi:hypothetical protein J4460_05405 [Candidatus Woesearchaeota archaeon]|nr:hypothetical protein [Candidatus Woesearchaeota archaeon]HIH38134.1 hypothetical protein [Candidatus Woesearchaeota archaeon]HIH49583.1 hypothetical protein [Candidatus Woesearchaeota archaeon]HIJ04393.1 hypothetical protein [Candidatus Woesearchaeota archaeon]